MTLKHLFFLVLRFCLPLVILATPAYLHAQMDKIKLEPIYSENQLSQSVAMSITQDRRGYFWVGTQDGLNRYDGYRFRTFKHKAFFPETLSASYIRALCVDRDEFLWIGGRSSGLDRYDWRSGTFSHYRNDPTDPHSLSHDFVTSVIEDKNGDIWVGTDNGLNRLDKKTGRFTRFMSGPSHGQGGPSPGQGGPSPRQGKPSPGQGKPSLGQGKPSPGRKNNPNPGSLTHDSILCLFQDGDGTLWIGTDGGGVNAFNPRTSDFFRYTVETTGQGLCSNSVRAICSDSEHPGVLWLGTSGGLSRFDVRRQEFTNYYHKPDEPRSLSLNDIGAIAEDNEGRLWIGTGTGPQVGNGITILDKKSMNFFRYTHHGDEARKLNNSSILDIFKDPMGVMWVGTYGSGVYKYDPKKHKFTHYKHKPGTNSLNTSEVWHISEDRDTNLWIGTLNGGVNFLDKKSGRFTHYMNEPENPNSLAHNSARALMVDRAGFVWIGTAVGLDFLDPESGRFIHYAPDADNPDCLPANVISFLMEDGRGNIWVGTWGGGLHRLDKSRNAFIHYTAGGAVPIKAERIACIYENPREVLWIGTAGNGLIRLDTKTYAVRQYRNEPNDPHSLSSNSVLCVCRHSSGSLWVATSGAGLNRLDETSGHFTHFSVDEGLPSNSIYSILEDGNGRLWMSTNNGLAQFNISDGKFINYTPADGLQGKEFNQGAYHKGRSGMLYFGGLNGFNSFNPADIYSNPNVPPIVVTDFKIFGKSVAPDPRGRYRYSGHQQAAIDLSYRDNFISFEFAALEYSDSQNNQYAYKMEGFDSQWVKCGTRRYAGYTNLDGGNYTLRIRGSNSDGTWNMEGLTMHIKVNPPLWKTLWFRILLMVIFAGLLILVFWARTLALQNKIRRQEQVRETLTESKIQLEKANELIQYRHNEVLKLIAAISSILVAVDSSREVYQWNVPAEEFFNLPREKCVNRSFTELMAPYIAPEVAEEILEAGFAPSRGVLQKEITAHVGGHAFLLQVVINPIMDNNGRKRGILLLCENISNRKEEETKKKHLLKLKLIGEMYAGIMHEVNTPVQYISINNKMISGAMGNIDRFVCGLKDYLDAEPGEKSPSDIRDMMDSENVEETLQKLSKAGKLIDDGINRVMEVSRTMKEFCHPGQGKMERCDINTLINSSLLVSRFKLKANIDIRLKLSETPITIYCYPAELNLVFLNLILNAADALKESGDNGRITISTKIRDDEVHIEVADTGTGIHAAIQEKVFNPFFTTKKVGQGTGQGLAIALKIIKEKHGGKLFFKSAPGTGTVFYIHLPIGKTGGDATE